MLWGCWVAFPLLYKLIDHETKLEALAVHTYEKSPWYILPYISGLQTWEQMSIFSLSKHTYTVIHMHPTDIYTQWDKDAVDQFT